MLKLHGSALEKQTLVLQKEMPRFFAKTNCKLLTSRFLQIAVWPNLAYFRPLISRSCFRLLLLFQGGMCLFQKGRKSFVLCVYHICLKAMVGVLYREHRKGPVFRGRRCLHVSPSKGRHNPTLKMDGSCPRRSRLKEKHPRQPSQTLSQAQPP